MKPDNVSVTLLVLALAGFCNGQMRVMRPAPQQTLNARRGNNFLTKKLLKFLIIQQLQVISQLLQQDHL